MKMISKNGYMIVDIILSISCIIMLSLPIIKTFSIISTEKIIQEENKKLLKIIEMQEEYIQSSNLEKDILNQKTVDGYKVKTSLEKKFNEKISKYKVEIYIQTQLKSKFYIIKYYN